MSTPDLITPALSEAVWVKSSHSYNNGDCVEIAHGTAWVKSSRSTNNGSCVEIAHGTAWAALRDSKNPDGPALVVPPATMRALVHAVRR